MSNPAASGSGRDRYDLPMQALHWAIALLIITAFVLIQVVDGMPRGAERTALMGVHKSVGATVILLVVLRLVWRRISPPPALPTGTSPLMALAAKGGHVALYVLMIAVPVVGVLMSQAKGRPVEVWGLFTLPALLGENKDLGHQLEEAHEVLGNLIMIVAGLHAAAAMFHQYVLKDGVLARMLPWGDAGRAREVR
ncbi:cytochrome b [Azospirillum canadense]|uniref:cytochrome b n=1 Tax=Azospirillum canadense TaxID=403962 RepID=UPI00222801A2|nr:cytochrome b [Azospirillum canadense]MCW2243404.1 cytochrome b561 [Azospirillum canadense]